MDLPEPRRRLVLRTKEFEEEYGYYDPAIDMSWIDAPSHEEALLLPLGGFIDDSKFKYALWEIESWEYVEEGADAQDINPE